MFNPMKLTTIFTIIALSINPSTSKCTYSWEGFGVYLGALSSFNLTTGENQSTVLSKLYDDLKIRNFRTEYMSQFSTQEDEYSIDCVDAETCAWIRVHSMLAKLPEKSIYVTIWSPPHYMKNWLKQLKTKYELPYYYYIKNVTALVEKSFGLTVEKVSIVNEPENALASWDRCLMTPDQLCQIIQSYDDPLVSLCAENAWFKISKLYHSFSLGSVSCPKSCPIMTSHAYKVNFNPFKDFGTVYYDLDVYSENPSFPVWITETSSTRSSAQSNEMDEAIDMSINIVNFVGKTCVQRWYYWYAFTISPSGESLIWFDQKTNQIYLPKKYYAYRHFTQSSFGSNDRLDCSTKDNYCLQFMPNGRKVYVNSDEKDKQIDQKCNLCCTTADNSYNCSQSNNLPSRSICSC